MFSTSSIQVCLLVFHLPIAVCEGASKLFRIFDYLQLLYYTLYRTYIAPAYNEWKWEKRYSFCCQGRASPFTYTPASFAKQYSHKYLLPQWSKKNMRICVKKYGRSHRTRNHAAHTYSHQRKPSTARYRMDRCALFSVYRMARGSSSSFSSYIIITLGTDQRFPIWRTLLNTFTGRHAVETSRFDNTRLQCKIG